MPTQREVMEQAMLAARNGGDYRALFLGKRLGFKLSSIKECYDDLTESGEEVISSSEGTSIPSGGTTGGSTVESGVIDKIIEIANRIRSGITSALTWLKEKFLALVNSFSKLKEALTNALSPLLTVMQKSLEWVIDLLFSIIPSAFINFVSGLIAAILPFIGQIKAAAEMLVSVGKYVKTWIEKRQLLKAATNIDSTNRFSQQARLACETMINHELGNIAADAALSTANCAVSVTGLIFTGNVASTVAGIASAVAKLCIQIAGIVKDCWNVWKGNAELDYLKNNPKSLHPAKLFSAAPILGAYYIGSATQSSIISFTGVGTSIGNALSSLVSGGLSASQWMGLYEQKARSLSPFRLKALQLVSQSRLELTENAVLGISWDVKDTIKGTIGSMLSDGATDVATTHTATRLGLDI